MEHYIILAVISIALLVCYFLLINERKKRLEYYERAKVIANMMSDYVIIWTSNLRNLFVNQAAVQEFGLTEKNSIEDFVKKIFTTGSEEYFSSKTLVTAFNPLGNETLIPDRYNELKCVLWKSNIIYKHNRTTYILTVGTLKVNENSDFSLPDQLKEIPYKNYEIGLETVGAGLFYVYSKAGSNQILLSNSLINSLGLKRELIYTIDELTDLFVKPGNLDFYIKLEQILNGEILNCQLELQYEYEPSKYRFYVLRMMSLTSNKENGTEVLGVLLDTSVQQNSKHFDDYCDIEDPLTNFLNRRGFMLKGADFLKQCNQKGKSAVMIAFKINRLQKINTLFGLETGDNILKMYASALSGIAPKSAILGRLGPDDFVILAEHIPSANITRMVKEVTFIMESNCADTSLPALLKEQIRFMAAVCYYDGVDDVMTLYNKCSVTLFNRSEKETNNVYYFDESIEMQVCERELLEQELLDAYKSGEFELYYQPKFNVSTGDILGLEALIRWNHPRKGIMYPDEFIPIAEEMGLLSKIDDWGLRTACMQNKIWQKLGYKPLIVSVNVSKDQFFRGNIVDRVKDALLYSRLEPKYLELELTETMAFNDIAETKKILQELKELGVSISMDDFGTGFSCLSSLKELCIDLLKIDRSLITDIHENITSGYITKAIVDLAKAMHLEILAEGVENVGQLESLANLGCDFAQGYYFDKPLPAMEFERKYLLSSVKNI